jgi:hypothetical protein
MHIKYTYANLSTYVCFADGEDVPIAQMEPRRVVQSADNLERFITYWLDHLPDLSDMPIIGPSQLMFWKKRNKSDRKRAHPKLGGLAAKWFNIAIDYGCEHNKWPVIFTDDDGDKNDLVMEFIVVVWVRYVSQMVLTRP